MEFDCPTYEGLFDTHQNILSIACTITAFRVFENPMKGLNLKGHISGCHSSAFNRLLRLALKH